MSVYFACKHPPEQETMSAGYFFAHNHFLRGSGYVTEVAHIYTYPLRLTGITMLLYSLFPYDVFMMCLS